MSETPAAGMSEHEEDMQLFTLNKHLSALSDDINTLRHRSPDEQRRAWYEIAYTRLHEAWHELEAASYHVAGYPVIEDNPQAGKGQPE